ncbi:MAG: DNA gyrase C-terminal beta-propeller domain-containing protein, partial [Pseudomonadota bacterium]
IVSNDGQLIRVPVDGIRVAGRATQGVTIFNVGSDDRVVSVERVSEPEDDDVEGEPEDGENGRSASDSDSEDDQG